MSSKRHRVVFIAVLTTLLIFYLQSQTGQRTSSWLSRAEKDVDWSRFAYTQYVTNSEYLCNSLMFFEALKRYGSRPDRVMMVPESMLEPEMVNSSDAYLLNKARDEYNVKLVPITIQTNWAGDATWADSYTKLLAFNQTKYDRVLSIDSDSRLLQAMDELFFLPDAPVAMPRAYWISPEKILSSQLMLIQPSETEFSRIMERVQSVKSGEYDMEIVNQLYGDSALIFPHRRYDLLSGEFRNDKHAHYLGSELETWDPAAAYSEAKLIHFSDWPLPKPWKPMREEDRLAAQPNCTRMTSGEEDCIVTESFWPNILADNPNAKPMKAICAICWDELHVTCISAPDDKLDIALVAPCGHVMCPKCWPRQVFDYYAVDFVAKRKCPICKTGLEFVACKKTCNKEMIPKYGGKANIECFSETAPECEREYRPCCKGCAGVIDRQADGFWF
ncbi:hypothetical protein QWA68_011971 [Fusarium oxysporum]|nr:hypothetical protein QWA68_011971 [Fusarium oxysporum]